MDKKQAQDGYKNIIAINRVRLTVSRKPMIADPITGDQVINPSGTAAQVYLYARITHERSEVPANTQKPSGLSTNLSRMIMCDYETTLAEHDVFEYEGKNFEVGPVDPILIFNAVIGYQAPLTEA